MDHLDVGEQPPRVGCAPHGIGADLETLAARSPEVVDRKTGPHDQRIGRRIARQRRADHEPGRVFIARHVLERMHRGIQLAGNNRLPDLGDKGPSLAAVLQQFAGLVGIA